jgi:hypothetical protein
VPYSSKTCVSFSGMFGLRTVIRLHATDGRLDTARPICCSLYGDRQPEIKILCFCAPAVLLSKRNNLHCGERGQGFVKCSLRSLRLKTVGAVYAGSARAAWRYRILRRPSFFFDAPDIRFSENQPGWSAFQYSGDSAKVDCMTGMGRSYLDVAS